MGVGAPRVATALLMLAAITTGCGSVDALRAGLAGGGRTGPDLVLHAVTVRQDRLVVLVANDGTREFMTPIMVSVSDGPPRQLDLGSPLRPGEALEAVLNTEYVQRRAQVTVRVATEAEADIELDNNQMVAIVEPDQPLDLAIEGATLDPLDGHLVVTVANRAIIPLVGTLAISVRERPPTNTLLAATERALEVAPGEAQVFDLRDVIRPDLGRITVAISTDAIADTDSANDVLPR